MFGGAVKTKQVRTSSTPNKKCVRSKMNRCLVHRCQFLEEERTKRILCKGEDGKVTQKTVVERVWKCGAVSKDEGSVSGTSSDLGGGMGGRRDVPSGSLTCGQEASTQNSSKHR